MDLNVETLLNPPFAQHPPVKIAVNAKALGAVIAVLSAISVLGLLALGTYLARYGGGGIVFLAVVGVVIDLVAVVVALVGGWRMYHENPEGKKFVIYSLAIGFVAQIVQGIGYYSIINTVLSLIVLLIVLAVIYYIVVLSRFPSQATQPS